MSMRLRSNLLFLATLTMGCGGAGLTGPGLKNVATCTSDTVVPDVPISNLPAWALADGSFAAWVGNDIVLAGGTPPSIKVAIIDGTTGQIRTLPLDGITAPRHGSDWRTHFALTGKRLVSLWHSYALPSVYGVVVDLTTEGFIQLPEDPAPDKNIFSTSPYLLATTQDAFVLWPRLRDNAPNQDSVIILDTRSGTWSSVSTKLGKRINPHVATVSNDRVVVWGGVADRDSSQLAATGVVINPNERSVRPFQYPRTRYGFAVVGDTGASIVNAAAGKPFLEGFVHDIDSGKTVMMPSVSLEKSFRNHTVTHFDGKYFLYVAKDELWVFDVPQKKWTSHLMPFEPNMPSSIDVFGLEGGRVFFTGTSTGDYIFHAGSGQFCEVLPRHEVPAPFHVLISPKRRAMLGGVTMTGGDAPDCPPGAPCATDEIKRETDTRGVITALP